MDLEIKVTNLQCKASTGGDLKITGSANAASSNGADIIVNVSSELTAKAKSGRDIKYLGNPEKVIKSGGVSGSLKQQ